ncbi:adenylate/guanylate cyclase domain-containing protein, partial [Desulfobacterales bacterium HSG16]|nr:adenylate/guanylate cyclase domain-containing protein [Desulfobacterales bacterium HSG16]
MKILIVDDSPIDVMLVSSFLNEVGYEDVISMQSADDALKLLNRKRLRSAPSTNVDLILMDIEMPGLSGIEACRQLKLSKHTQDIPIIIITAKSDMSSFKLAFSAGAHDFLLKPVQKVALQARINAALQLKKEINIRKTRENDLRRATGLLNIERKKAEQLLFNILPETIAKELKKKGSIKPQLYEDISVFLSDIVGFTKLSSMLDPESLIEELNDMFTAFDDIMEKHDCERIKTIGDAYLAVCGMPEKNPLHAKNIVKAALEIIKYLEERNDNSLIQWKIRIGIHSGDVVGSIVGIKKYIYDVEVIVMTGYSGDYSYENAVDKGASDLVFKP